MLGAGPNVGEIFHVSRGQRRDPFISHHHFDGAGDEARGVRSSWLTVARKRLLRLLACSASAGRAGDLAQNKAARALLICSATSR